MSIISSPQYRAVITTTWPSVNSLSLYAGNLSKCTWVEVIQLEKSNGPQEIDIVIQKCIS